MNNYSEMIPIIAILWVMCAIYTYYKLKQSPQYIALWYLLNSKEKLKDVSDKEFEFLVKIVLFIQTIFMWPIMIMRLNK